MDLKEIKALIDLITEKGISEFELERSGVRIKIIRNAGNGPAAVASAGAETHVPAGANLYESASQPVASNERSAEASPLEAAILPEVYVVRSPMVGTFYSAPSPEAEPFVRVGDKVHVRQVICIIEAMKLMNEIEAEVAGEVIRCYVENGQPVEYGEPLFDLKPL